LSSLRRTQIGELRVENAQTIEKFLTEISGSQDG